MKASSEFGKAVDYLTVKYGRLRGAKAWCPATKDGNDWLEVDLGAVYRVCGVATQGKEHRTDEWTTKFKLAFSVSNTSSRVYRENGQEKVIEVTVCPFIKYLFFCKECGREIKFLSNATVSVVISPYSQFGVNSFTSNVNPFHFLF